MTKTKPPKGAISEYLDRPATIRLPQSAWLRIGNLLRPGELRSAFVRVAVLEEIERREASVRRRGAAL